ncbi:MAG: VOC family protein [Rhodobacterales bacterium]|nr:VOC family protein [Rhodobacterales bacterium]
MRPLVQRLGHVAVDSTDPERLAADMTNILGTRIVGRQDGRILVSSNARHAEFVIHKADRDGLRQTGLEAVSPEAVDQVTARAGQAGLKILSTTPSLPAIAKSVTFATSEGHVYEVHSPMPHDRALRYLGPGAHPKCADHVNFTAVDPKTWAEEMAAACGFILSQRTTGYEISWMRAADGRHHTVAAVKSHAPGVHHISWEFNAFEDFKRLGDALTCEDRRLVWGPGRHGAGDNLFLYFKAPGGFLFECIAEMEMIHDDLLPTRIADPGENLSNWKVVNQWGALPPREWVEHHTPLAV